MRHLDPVFQESWFPGIRIHFAEVTHLQKPSEIYVHLIGHGHVYHESAKMEPIIIVQQSVHGKHDIS